MHSRRHLPGYAVGLAALAYCGLVSAQGLYPIQFASAANSPAAVVAADFNGDGNTDLAEVGLDGTVAVLLNRPHPGHLRLPKAYYQAGALPVALVAGDFNRDGKLDIAVANSTSGTVSVLLGNGDGTFVALSPAGKGTAAPQYTVGGAPESIAVADLAGDGKLDLITANFADGTVSVLSGKGDGTFRAATTIPVGAGPTFVAVADLNGDGKPDILVSNSSDATLGVLLGNGDGTFKPETLTAFGAVPATTTLQMLVVGDFDHDGNVDVVSTTTDINGETVVYLRGKGDGTFRAPVSILSGLVVRYLQAADVDGDGNLDLIMGSFTNATLRVRFGDGHGGFGKPQDYPASGINSGLGVQAFVATDIDGDGKPDIAAVNSSAGFIQVLYNDGSGGFHLPNSYATGHIPSDVANGDLNGDGHADLVEIDSADGTLGVRLGVGNGTFGPLQTYGVGSHPQRVLLADLDGDGKLDAVTVNNGDATVSVLLGNGDGTFQSARSFPAGANPVDLAIADMDQDGKPDLVVANSVVNTVSILRGDGAGGFLAGKAYPAGSQINALAAGDVDRDGMPDVVTVGGNVAVLYNDGAGGLKTIVLNDDGTSDEVYPAIGVRVALADLRHDNRLDIVITDYSNSQIAVFLGQPKGLFSPAPVDFSTCTSPTDMAFADLNADGNLDLTVTCVGSSSIGVMLGNGKGAFIGNPYPVEIDPRGLTVGDFDEDGQPDLAVVNGGSDNLNILKQVRGVVADDTAPTVKGAPFFVPNGNTPVPGILNGLDKDNDALSFGVVSPPSGGVVASSPDGGFVYLANTGFVGHDSFEFQASDGVKLSNISTIPVTVAANTTSSSGGNGGFLGGFALPLLPLLLGLWLRRRRD